MGPLKIQELSQAPWLPGSRLPVHTWLVPDQTEEDAARLRALGNIVIPQCCRLALHLHANDMWF